MAHIVSINISTIKGQRKTPVGSAEVRAGHGIVGDGHAGPWHRQVSLLAGESIEKMTAMGLDVGPGDFAENVTTSGIDLPALPVGTKLRLGPALVEVTQIGKECHDRCEIFRQAGDCVMPREGIFVRVLEGGDIGAGDSIEVAEASTGGGAGETQGHHTNSLQGEKPAVTSFKAAVVTVSDKGHRGERADESGDLLERLLREAGAAQVSRVLLPDQRQRITEELIELCRSAVDLVITTGGTGLSPRDVTPEATLSVIEREAPGFSEAIRAASQALTARAMLSRAVSGIRGQTLIINFPGSPKACEESFEVIRPVIGHALELLSGECGDCAR